MNSFYRSSDLIESVKRKIAFPISQNTFSEEDILKFANEEMMISMVPSVLQFHEEYFVFRHRIPLEPEKLKYPVPDRAIGMRLRDIFFVDTNGNLSKMSRIEPEDRTYYYSDNINTNTVQKFYLEGNDIVLLLSPRHASIGHIEFIYYLRPNQLVTDDRAATCTNFSKTITVSNTGLTAGDTVTIGSTVFTAGTDFAIGATSLLTATNLASAITVAGIVTSASTGVVSTNIVNIKYKKLSTEFTTSNATSFVIQQTQGIEFDKVPDHFESEGIVDFLQTRAGHKTYSLSVSIPVNAISGNVINFLADDVPEDFIVGDYICSEYECIIPQIPDDLHVALAERTCARILQSLGDLGGLESTNAKISEIDARQGTLIDNRSEGNPQKLNNTNSLLKLNKRRRYYGRY